MTAYQAHATAIIDPGAQIGAGSRVWHWVHICGGAVIGGGCSLGQNVFVGNRVRIGNNVKIQNNVSVYDNVTLEDDVFCGPSMVFTNVYNPRSAVSRKDEYRDTLVKAGATLRCKLHNCVRRDGWRKRLYRRRRRRESGRQALRSDGRCTRASDRLDQSSRQPPRSSSRVTAARVARTPARPICCAMAFVSWHESSTAHSNRRSAAAIHQAGPCFPVPRDPGARCPGIYRTYRAAL